MVTVNAHIKEQLNKQQEVDIHKTLGYVDLKYIYIEPEALIKQYFEINHRNIKLVFQWDSGLSERSQVWKPVC